MLIALTGVAGVGKTSVARALVRVLPNAKLISLASYLKRKKLYEGYDRKLRSYVVDPARLKKEFRRELAKLGKWDYVVIDGLLSHYLDVDLVVVLRCSPRILEERLKHRRYPKQKILQNLLAEFCDVLYAEAIERRRRVVQIDVSNRSAEEVAMLIKRAIENPRFSGDRVDWLGSEADFLVGLERKYGNFKKLLSKRS